MTTIDRHRKTLRYEFWANEALLVSMEVTRPLVPHASPDPNAEPSEWVKLFAHILGAQWLWLARITHATSPLPIWPVLSLEECRPAMVRSAEAWSAYLIPLDLEELAREIEYVNSRGEQFTSSVEEILVHLSHHSAYHRGQIATQMRAEGLEPAYTDYIHASRTGALGGE